MKITPLDIHQKQFPVKFRGCDKDEVDSFLKLVKEELEELLRENATLKEEAIKAEKEIKDFKESESCLRNMLIGTQQLVEEYKNNAHKEAEIIKKEAELQALNIIEAAQQKLFKMQEEIADLKGVRKHFKEEVRQLIENHLKILDRREDTETEHTKNLKTGENGNDKRLLELKNSQIMEID
jgi:cell division initiation protein